MSEFNFYCPTQIMAGAGRVKELAQIVLERGGSKVFLVVDPFLRNSEAEKKVIKDLEDHKIQHVEFYEIVSNPRNTSIDKGAQICIQENCDFIVAIGGGSGIDSAKAISLVAKFGGECWEYTERQGEDVKRPTGSGLPLVVCPTTAGTGTEATLVAVINNPEQTRKCAIINPAIYPTVSIIDAELMLSVPKELTALTGIDTFAHAFEAFICTGANELTDALAIHAMKLFSESIRDVVNDGNNIEARSKMAMSCCIAGAAFSNAGVCLPHAMGQPLSAFTDAPHGGTLAACLPQIIKWTIPSAQKKFAIVADIMDAKGVSGLGEKEKAEKLPGLFEKLYQDLDVHVSFSGYGLKESDLEEFVDLCFTGFKQDIDHHPKKVNREDIKDIVKMCM